MSAETTNDPAVANGWRLDTLIEEIRLHRGEMTTAHLKLEKSIKQSVENITALLSEFWTQQDDERGEIE